MTKRIKITLPQIQTRDEAEALVNDLALIANNQRKITAQRDALVLEINRRFEASLGQCSIELQTKTETLRAWAEANPDQFAKGRKSIDFVSGTIGFRTGTPKLSLLSRAWHWEAVIGALKSSARRFLRTKEEPDKEAILGEYSQHALTDADLKTLGLKVTQDETFFVEPKLTELETRQVTEAA